jgi:hypothetical protein
MAHPGSDGKPQHTFFGAVAMAEPYGSRWKVLTGEFAGQVFQVEDRYGRGTQMDIALPGECGRALNYGRPTISIQRVG